MYFIYVNFTNFDPKIRVIFELFSKFGKQGDVKNTLYLPMFYTEHYVENTLVLFFSCIFAYHSENTVQMIVICSVIEEKDKNIPTNKY